MEEIFFRFDYFLLFFFRTAAFLGTVPILGTSFKANTVKITFAFLLATLLFPVCSKAEWNRPDDFFPYVVMIMKECLIGFFMSFVWVFAINAVRIAGDLIGIEMGMTLAAQVDPVTGSSTPLIAYMYEIMAVLIFLSLNFHHWFFQALASSYDILPVGKFDFAHFSMDWILVLFRQMLTGGLILAAPVFAVMTMVSLAMALLSRAVPNFNILDVGYTLRVGVASGAMLFFMPGFVSSTTKLFGHFREGMFGLLRSLAA